MPQEEDNGCFTHYRNRRRKAAGLARGKGHKKQHFVPVCYLKPWRDPAAPTDHAPYVWIFDHEGGNPRRKAPENILHETDMYTVEIPGSRRSLVLEHGLQELESTFTRIRNSKINFARSLEDREHVLLCAFVAATQTRTRASREHHRKLWEHPLRMMEDMMEWATTATPEQKRNAARTIPRTSESDRGSLNYEQVKALHENPLQHILAPMIKTLTPLLYKLDMAVLETDDEVGFITSDHPCVWSDPEGYKRPPMYRGPALMYPSIEITMPISPRHCLFLNRGGMTGYITVSPQLLDSVNRTTRFGSDEHFIVRTNFTKSTWFDPGVEPDDSWEKMHAEEIAKRNDEMRSK
jgi:hypothetical protein